MELETKLAIDGGPKVRDRPMPPWPAFDDEMIRAVEDVLLSGRVNQWTGDRVEAFQAALANRCGSAHGIAVANGTVALELALVALGIGPGDEVIVTPRTFIASASCAMVRGATPVFVDVDPNSQNISAAAIREAIGHRTRAIIAVHLAGWPCEMDSILRLAQEHDIPVIEDCAQALGATYRGKPVGSFGHLAAFSFCQDKIITTGGEGGMLLTGDDDLRRRAWSYKDHGKDESVIKNPDPSQIFQWLHRWLGTNWRMTEMQAAIGLVALERLDEWLARRRRAARMLDERLVGIDGLRIPRVPKEIEHAYYKYYAFIRPEMLDAQWTRDRIVLAIQAEGIPCGSGSCGEIYLEHVFDDRPCRPEERLEVAQRLGETSLMLQVHPTLEEEDIMDIARAIEKVCRAAIN